ncbi:MAG: hypothetical protein K0R59_1748 [Sphingobacterium sp.]|jgi:hypothetical protein|nr:hypothetical protein [Sphingobacterium sp.]
MIKSFFSVSLDPRTTIDFLPTVPYNHHFFILLAQIPIWFLIMLIKALSAQTGSAT